MTLQEATVEASTKYVLFSKVGCPFCTAALVLMSKLLENKIIPGYVTYTIDREISNQTLLLLGLEYGWKADGEQPFPSKPQIFMKGEYIGGNSDFYNSKWNLGENMPNLKNPMRF